VLSADLAGLREFMGISVEFKVFELKT
jgi:hypothetical protein